MYPGMPGNPVHEQWLPFGVIGGKRHASVTAGSRRHTV